jgi:hypothetical protein
MILAWHNFWFDKIDARQLALLRIAFGALSLLYFMECLPYLDSQFSPEGWLGQTRTIEIQNGGSWSLFFMPATKFSHNLGHVWLGVGMLAAVSMTAGWHSRKACALVWLIWVSLWNRNPLILDGDDAVLKMMAFYLMLSPCGNAWSLDANRLSLSDKIEVWPLRLMQAQIALIYLVSGWVKFHSPEWNDGSILKYVLIHPHYARWNHWAVIDHEMFAVVACLLANLIRWWELLFPLLLLTKLTRIFALVFGIAFHLGLLLTMNLRWFPLVMLALYPALLTPSQFRSFIDSINRYRVKIAASLNANG